MPALLRLARPLDVVLFFFAAAIGGVLTADASALQDNGGRLLLAMAAAALVGGGSNVVNDLYDRDIDRINRPDRPLVSGAVSPGAAWAFWAALSAVGVGLGVLASPVHGAIALVSVVGLWAYSAYVKRLPALGNVVVAGVITLGVVYGGLAAGPPTPSLWAGAGLAFTILLAREIAKDVEDEEGDRAGGARTLPIVWGARRTLRLVAALVGVSVLVLPLVAHVVGPAFFVYGLALAACLLAALWALASGGASAARAHAASRWLKIGLGVGIVVLALARLS